MSNEIFEYYSSIWNDKCERAGVDENKKGILITYFLKLKLLKIKAKEIKRYGIRWRC